MGAAAFLGAVLWTVFTTKEYPPENLEEFRKQKAAGAGLVAGAREMLASILAMPRTMRQLAWVQICTWLGLYCMWLYFPVAVARNVFGAADTNSPLYTTGVEWAGVCFGMYSLVCFGFSFVLPALARKFGRKATHALCLICGGLGLLSVAVIHTKLLLLLSMIGVGVAWAGTLSMPYAIRCPRARPESTWGYSIPSS
jgi:maltose/moltooligosaccharide transporter